jgi:hypothetical protein
MTNTKKKNKNTRKLLGAIGMLSVSAAMLVSSTFAWFAMNKKVTASTMTVKAKSYNPYLLINQVQADGGADPYATSETLANTSAIASETFKLVHPNATNVADASMGWKEAQAADPAAYTASGSLQTVTLEARTDIPQILKKDGTTDASGENYVLAYDLYFKTSNDTNATNLKLALQTESTATDRGVYLTVGGTDISTMTDITDDTTGRGQFERSTRIVFINQDSPTNFAIYSARDNSITYGTSGILAPTVTKADGSVHLKVYMYFDGEDVAAYTNNANTFAAVAASFNFIVDDSASDV